ncbi:MAG: hypothetical protein JWO19_4476 [Bryobacterales bacterium]|nr:hypothetical protein [Bryobacterales bacterium]
MRSTPTEPADPPARRCMRRRPDVDLDIRTWKHCFDGIPSPGRDSGIVDRCERRRSERSASPSMA